MNLPPSIAGMRASAGELGLLLASWCDQNSGSENFAGLEAMVELLKAEFGRLPGAVEYLPLTITPAEALRIRVRPEAPLQLLFSGHYDTAYGITDAFQQCEFSTAEKMRGPGVIDMKGGLVVMHAALEAFERSKHSGKIGYEVLLTPDKETGSYGSAVLLAKTAKRHQFGFVFEPARPNGDLVQSRKGTGRFIITCFGRSGQGAGDGRAGPNAKGTLTDFLSQISRLPEELPGVLVTPGPIRGGGAATEGVSVFSDAELDVSITHRAQIEVVLARLHALAAPFNAGDGCKLEIGGGFERPPMAGTPATEKVFATWQQCGRDLGVAPFSWTPAHRSSDANLLAAAGLPCLDGLGPIGDKLHSPKEWVHLPSLVERAQITALFLHRLAAGEIPLPPRPAV
jgi:glutamate carboxypeptidase